MILKRLASEYDLGSVKLQNGVQVLLDAFVGPSKDGANSEILEAAASCLLLHLLKKACFTPVSVHEHNGLC